jgi:hypothetical protein
MITMITKLVSSGNNNNNSFKLPFSIIRYNSKRICQYFLNKRVRYAIESATARYPIIEIKLAMVEAMKG